MAVLWSMKTARSPELGLAGLEIPEGGGGDATKEHPFAVYELTADQRIEVLTLLRLRPR